MSIRSELELLQEQHGGILQPEVAVAWAEKHRSSALHSALEWNDEKAGHQFRLQQVRQLIIINIRNEEGVREAISLSVDRHQPGGGYRELHTVLASKKLREVLLSDALAELERVRLKYESLSELARVWSAVDQVRDKEQRKNRRNRKGGDDQPSVGL